MLPNWLYTQNLLPMAVAADAANAAVPRAQVIESLLASPLNGALLRIPFGGGWEQTGRALAALGTVCPETAIAFAGHLAEQHRRGRGAGPGLLTAAEVNVEPASAGASSYLVLAALLASAAVGIATTGVRQTIKEETPEVGSAVTAVLTAQAGILRVLSMLDALIGAGKDVGGTVSASFHTVVRGSARLLEATPAKTAVFAATGHPVLQDDPWDHRVELALSGDWSAFGVSE
ncbi:hypothetical protein [Amycolatopsis sp. NPDC059657]|uniref:hypothetical protein n=1 Tax=Amycolatopsis sp. NPDC059657 TaxID=3346899 RepID=UPI0036703768